MQNKYIAFIITFIIVFSYSVLSNESFKKDLLSPRELGDSVGDNIILYRFENKELCGNNEVDNINNAMKEIEKQTKYLVFKESDNEEILFKCVYLLQSKNSDKVLGESLGNIIDNKHSIVTIYGYEFNQKKLYPSTEMHEILHSLGFKDVDNYNDLMCNYNYYPSNTRIENYILIGINKTYFKVN